MTGNNGAAEYMLTAAHCGEGEWRTGAVVSGGTTFQNTLGSTIPGRALAQDGEAIHTPLGSSAFVYVGNSINPDTGDLGSNTVVQVGGAANSFIGDLVCTGGAFSGTICGIRVAATGLAITFDPPANGVGAMTGMVNAQLVGQAAAGQGDSGGPVYAINPGTNTITARGVISAIDAQPANVLPCQGYSGGGRVCSRSMFYGPVLAIMSTIGVHINTS